MQSIRRLIFLLLFIFIPNLVTAEEGGLKAISIKLSHQAQWGGEGSEPGQFRKPSELIILGGKLLILDAGNHRLQSFDLKNDFRVIGGWGRGILQFFEPADLYTLDGLDVYIADTGNRRICRLDKHLNWLGSFKLKQDENYKPVSICLSNEGYFYVGEANGKQVFRIESLGERKQSLFIRSGTNYPFNDIFRIRIFEQHIWISDQVGGLHGFDQFGTPLFTISEAVIRKPGGISDTEGKILLCDEEGQKILILSAYGKIHGEIVLESCKPIAALIYKHHLWVLDCQQNLLRKYEINIENRKLLFGNIKQR